MTQGSANQVKATEARWSSRYAFVLAATGSAVGLGNIWKFPYITGEYGGGAFVLVYLICIMLIGVPVMMCEVFLGRRARRSPVNAYATVAAEDKVSGNWKYAGYVAIVAGLLVVSFYTVISGWSLAYVFEAASGSFKGADAESVAALFGNLTGDPLKLLFWSTLMLGATALTIGYGVSKGIEKSLKWLMPLLFLILLGLLGYAAFSGGFQQGFSFMFSMNFDALSANGVVIALGHAFFTLSLGAGMMLVYGAYLPEHVSIPKAVGIVAVADTLVALIAGMAIFPIVFANGLSPQQGPGLVFQTLTLAFGNMTAGGVVGTSFFVMLTVAAFASLISLIEVLTVFMTEKRGWSRKKSVTIVCSVVWVMSIGTVLSFNIGQDWRLFGLNYFGIVDYLSTNILLPTSGLLIALFIGWKVRPDSVSSELGIAQGSLRMKLWMLISRFVAPLLILLVFVNAIGLIRF